MREFRFPVTNLLLLAAAVHLLYHRTWNAGFVTDFTGLQWRLEGQPWHGFLLSFGYPALEPLLHLFLYVFYRIFEAEGLPWYLLFTTIHIANAWLLYGLARRVMEYLELPDARALSLAATWCFALSPVHAEPLVWRVCLNFLLSGFFVLAVLHLAMSWLQTGKWPYLWSTLLGSTVALFTYEYALVIPALCLLMAGLLAMKPSAGLPLRKRLGPLALPQWVMIALYFLLNKIVLGQWIGHYGPAVHLRFNLIDMAANFWRYVAKLLLFARYWAVPDKEALQNCLSQAHVALGLSLVLLLVAGIVAWRYWQRPSRGQAALFWLIGFGMVLGPVMNLYCNYLLYVDGDRYAYVPSLFFFPLLAILLGRLGTKPALWAMTLLALISSALLVRSNRYWREGTQVYYQLLENYRWQDSAHVFVLNLPENYQGTPMFRDYSGADLALYDALYYMARKKPAGTVREVLQYNMVAPNDGVKVEVDSSGVLHVQFQQHGNWWWRRGLGATPHQMPEYRCEPSDGAYRLYLDSIPPGSLFLYQVSGRWHVVSPSR